MSDTSNKAQRSFITAINALLKKEWIVAVPLDHSSTVDLVARMREGGAWYNIQVKSFYKDGASMIANLQRTTLTGRKPYDHSDIDLFILVDGDEAIFIHSYSANDRTRVSLSTARRLQRELGCPVP